VFKRTAAIRRERDREPYYRALGQAEVGAAQLTNHAAWNWFLQLLASAKAESEQFLEGINANARISDDFSYETLSKVQAIRRVLDARIKTLEEVMALPAQILDDAKIAKRKLGELKSAKSKEKAAG